MHATISQRLSLVRLIGTLVCALLMAHAASAQTSSFTYQGRLTDAGAPASGSYEMQFMLFNGLAGGTQQPQASPVTLTFAGAQAVTVTNGVFTVQLDFGAGAFPGADRYLEIGFRHPGETSFTPLSPRQQLASTPYAVRSLSAAAADTATNATQLGGVAAGNYVQNDDSRLSDSRQPRPGSSDYIQNTTSPQSASDFSISGNGTAGGTLSGNTVNAATQYKIAGERVLSVAGDSLFAGRYTGVNNTTGSNNAFFGTSAGQYNTVGSYNSFFGTGAGQRNTEGGSNSFFGMGAGSINTSGSNNSFFGKFAGLTNTTGSSNSFFGRGAGESNTMGFSNSFFGTAAGQENTTGIFNSFVGANAGINNTTGENSTYVGASAGASNTTGGDNSLFGKDAGVNNTTGGSNTFVGTSAGEDNTMGDGNTFVGASAGRLNTTGANNTIIGSNANVGGTGLHHATAVGAGSTVTSNNTVVLGRSFDIVQVPGNLNVSYNLSTLNLNVSGILTKGAGTFKIDHPLDAANKYLYHSFIESPDMMNIYNGNVTTDKSGDAVVRLPAYFEALNRDFRYQLTVIGQFAQAIVSHEIEGNTFKITTDKPNVKVSWLVTGIRRDKFAEDNRIQVEVEKTLAEKGKCLYAPLCVSAAANPGASSTSEGQGRSKQ